MSLPRLRIASFLTVALAFTVEASAVLVIDAGNQFSGDGTIDHSIINYGTIMGSGPTVGDRFVFSPATTVSGTGHFVNTLSLGVFAPGNSPGTTSGEDQAFGGTIEIDLGGLTPGTGSGHHDQINDSRTIFLDSGPGLKILSFENFIPNPGDEFVIMTWQTGLDGVFGPMIVDQSFADIGIGFSQTINNPTGAGNLVLKATAVPEPSAIWLFVCVLAMTFGRQIASVWSRQRRKTSCNFPVSQIAGITHSTFRTQVDKICHVENEN